MAHVVLFSIAAGTVVVWVFGAVFRRRRRARSTAETPVPPRSLVRILTSEAELDEAVSRAACFENMVAETLQARRRRYEEMAAGAAPGGRTRVLVIPDETARSA